MSLIAPYATDTAPLYGEIKGSSPNWQQATFTDRGRVHGTSGPSELSSQGLEGWYQQAAPSERRLVKNVQGPVSSYYGEPVVRGANPATSYFSRRAVDSDDPTHYRRMLRHIPQPAYVDRPTGKKAIPEPYGQPPRPQGVQGMPDELRRREPQHASEPGMPRLARPYGATILRESDTELSYERAFGRKVRVGQDTYRGAGRAGDLSQSFAPPKRPEDDGTFFKSLKDAPTFIRFVASLPAKPAVSPHERHAQQQHRLRQAELEAECEMVASLKLPDDEEDAAAGRD